MPGLAPYIPLLRRETLEEKEEVLKKFQNSMKYFETELKNRGTTYFGGQENPGMLDYMIWPWLERAEIVPLMDERLELLPKQDFPLLVIIFFTFQRKQTITFKAILNGFLMIKRPINGGGKIDLKIEVQ